MRLDRRSVLALIGAGSALPAAAQPTATTVRFEHGVASGDPATDGAVLWTRATPPRPGHGASIPLTWKVATTPEAPLVASGTIDARPAEDFTAKVEVRRLKPGCDYHYWFEAADGTRSPVGRFRTLPTGRTDEAVLAFVSCQLHPGGLFNAYEALSRSERLDAIVHLGDYIYEYGPEEYGGSIGAKLGRVPEPPHEIVTLADYRQRHAQYKRDPDLKAAHARAAFICVWDDHETANDSWTGGAENHQPESEGDWRTRKAAALQAYFEWMPIRDPKPGKPWESINRSFQFGDLASLAMVETRLLARSHQAVIGDRRRDAAGFAAVLAERDRPERELLGEPQRRWLAAELKRSVHAGTPWQLLRNQVVMARVAGPRLDKLVGAEKAGQMLQALPAAYRARAAESMRPMPPASPTRPIPGTVIPPRANGSTPRCAMPDRPRSCCQATATPSGRTICATRTAAWSRPSSGQPG